MIAKPGIAVSTVLVSLRREIIRGAEGRGFAEEEVTEVICWLERRFGWRRRRRSQGSTLLMPGRRLMVRGGKLQEPVDVRPTEVLEYGRVMESPSVELCSTSPGVRVGGGSAPQHRSSGRPLGGCVLTIQRLGSKARPRILCKGRQDAEHQCEFKETVIVYSPK